MKYQDIFNIFVGFQFRLLLLAQLPALLQLLLAANLLSWPNSLVSN